MNDERESKERHDLVPPNLSGLDPEEILRGFMQVDLEKVKERLESEGDEREQEG